MVGSIATAATIAITVNNYKKLEALPVLQSVVSQSTTAQGCKHCHSCNSCHHVQHLHKVASTAVLQQLPSSSKNTLLTVAQQNTWRLLQCEPSMKNSTEYIMDSSSSNNTMNCKSMDCCYVCILMASLWLYSLH